MKRRRVAPDLASLPPDRWPALLKRSHLSAILSCSDRTVSRLLADALPSIVIGKTRFVRREALLQLLEEREQFPRPDGPPPRRNPVTPRPGRPRAQLRVQS